MAERDWREGRSPAQNRRLARIPEDKREELSRGTAGLYRTGAEFTPGVGDALTAQEVYDAAKQGDYSTAALLATLAAIGLVPGAGDAVSAAGKALLKDAAGEPLMLFRGLRGGKGTLSQEGISANALNIEPRNQYNVFASDSPYVAGSYANPDLEFDEVGAIAPFHVLADEIIEFPVKVGKDGSRSFDKLEFDKRARLLKPNQVLVARQVYDIGPAANTTIDPEKLYSYASDVYALGRGAKTIPAVGTQYRPKFKTREGKPFASGGSVTMPSNYSKGRWRLI